ncbi:MAG: hypothetical protein HYT38_00190 [Candidatus Sungbacteria bacterium]|uniref:Transmembrane protein n=1 Tax=Candidatus Sungiibacteriota bacterium TaxID=2750080 RepID=A0A9D6HTM7_9BACT|nr:hypothetical protein [Candidatus Sungbacteria bacterium]
MNPEDQNQNSQLNQYRNKIILAAVAVVVIAAGFYLLLKKDSGTAEDGAGVKYEAVPAVVLNVAANKLWLSFPLDEDKKVEFVVLDTTSIVRLDFTSNGPQENKISLAELRQGDNILVYYKVKGDELELNRVEFLNFPPPPEGVKVPINPPAF